jgi:ribosomal protein L37AE/L43A
MGIWKCTKCGNSTGNSNKPLVGTCIKGGKSGDCQIIRERIISQ